MANDVEVDFAAKMDDVKEQLNSLKGHATSWGGELKNIFTGTFAALSFTKLIEGASAAFHKVTDIIQGEVKEWIAAYTEASQVDAQLAAALKSTGREAEFSQEHLSDLATSIEHMTTFGDEAIKSVETLLLKFKDIKGDEFEHATALAADMAARMGGDAAAAADHLGMMLNNPARAMKLLAKEGMDLSAQQKEMVNVFLAVGDKAAAQRVILEQLEGAYGGAAEAAADAAGGGMKQLQEQIGDIREELGKKLLDAIGDVIPALQSLADEGGKILKDFVDSIIGVGKGFTDSFGQGETASEKLIVAVAGVAHNVKVAALAIEDYFLRIQRLREIAEHPFKTVFDSKQTDLEKQLKRVQEERSNVGTSKEASDAALSGFRESQSAIEAKKKSDQKAKDTALAAQQAADAAKAEAAKQIVGVQQAMQAFQVFGALGIAGAGGGQIVQDKTSDNKEKVEKVKKVKEEEFGQPDEVRAQIEDAASMFRRIQTAAASPEQKTQKEHLEETKKGTSHLATIATQITKIGARPEAPPMVPLLG
jgi:tail length tape measure protein